MNKVVLARYIYAWSLQVCFVCKVWLKWYLKYNSYTTVAFSLKYQTQIAISVNTWFIDRKGSTVKFICLKKSLILRNLFLKLYSDVLELVYVLFQLLLKKNQRF